MLVEEHDVKGLTDIEEKELANKNRPKGILTKEPQMQNRGSKHVVEECNDHLLGVENELST